MANIIEHSDFVGKYKLSQNSKLTAKVTEYITKFQPRYIYQILGVDLGNALIADIDAAPVGTPSEPRFVQIFNAFQFDDNNGIRVSIGLREIMLGFLYFELMRDANMYNTLAGNKKTEGENNEFADPRSNVSTVYGISVESVHAIQWYILTNPDDNSFDYDDYNGQVVKYLMNF